jgi:hypothetical protein
MPTEILKRGEDVNVDSIVATPKEESATSYGYGVTIQASNATFHTGGAAKKRYLLYVDGSFASGGTAFTGDSNGAAIRVSGSNYVAHDSNYIYRGINIGYNNRSGGSMGRLENLISVQNKSGGTVPYLLACTFTMENYGTSATEVGVADFVTRNEANTATLSYGIRIRNDDQSGQGAVQSAINITSHASSGGFRELIDASGAVLTEYDSGTKVVLMKFQGANGTTYYLVHDTDSSPTAVSVATSVS